MTFTRDRYTILREGPTGATVVICGNGEAKTEEIDQHPNTTGFESLPVAVHSINGADYWFRC